MASFCVSKELKDTHFMVFDYDASTEAGECVQECKRARKMLTQDLP